MLTQPKQEVPGEAAVSNRAFGRSKGDLRFNLDSNNMSRKAREKCLSDKARGTDDYPDRVVARLKAYLAGLPEGQHPVASPAPR